MPVYTEDDVIIDPVYESILAYGAKFDYDLLGHSLSSDDSFLDDPVGFVRKLVRKYKMALLSSSIILFLLYFTFITVRWVVIHCIRLIKIGIKYSKDNVSMQLKWSDRNRQGLIEDYDLKAQAPLRLITTLQNISRGVKFVLPENLIEYEAIRFALQAIWPSALASRALDEVDPFVSLDDEPIEGKSKDAKFLAKLDAWAASQGEVVIEEWEDEVEPLPEMLGEHDYQQMEDEMFPQQTDDYLFPEVPMDEDQYMYDDQPYS